MWNVDDLKQIKKIKIETYKKTFKCSLGGKNKMF